MAKSPSFLESSNSFFDELSEIEKEKQRKKEDHMDKTNDRPYSSMLTQDEEPVDDGNPATLDEEEPEVVTRSYA